MLQAPVDSWPRHCLLCVQGHALYPPSPGALGFLLPPPSVGLAPLAFRELEQTSGIHLLILLRVPEKRESLEVTYEVSGQATPEAAPSLRPLPHKGAHSSHWGFLCPGRKASSHPGKP